jgi:pilus assembly protein CpaB
MENRKPIVIAIVCFLVSLLLIWGYTTIKRKEMTAEFGEEVDVIVANENIPEYAILRPEMLRKTKIFKKFLQPQTVSEFEDIVGKASYVSMYRDEQVTLTKLVHSDGKPVLDRQVEKKMRAMTVQVSPHNGVGRLIRPGNRVDILAAVSYEQASALQFEVKTVFQNVLVLATGKNLQNQIPTRINRNVLNALEGTFEEQKRKDIYNTSVDTTATTRPDDNYATITLQLTPEEAEKLLFLQHTIGDSRLYFTLRNGADMLVSKIDTTILDQVLGPDSDYGRSKVRPPPSNPPKPKYYDSKGGQSIPVY